MKTENLAIFTVDTALVVGSWSQGMADMSGVPASSAIGANVAALIPDFEERGLAARFRRVIEFGGVDILSPAIHHYLLPCRLRMPSEHFEWMQQAVVISPLQGEQGIVGAIVTVEDVTERLEAERQIALELSSPDEKVRIRAAEKLAAGGPATAPGLVASIGDESWRVRRAAVSGMARNAGPDIVGPLLSAIREQHDDFAVLNSALAVLARCQVDVVAPLIELLGSGTADLRMYAALALGMQHQSEAGPSLVQALSDPDPNVVYHAIEALGRLQYKPAVEPLVDIVTRSDFFLAFPALDALIRIGDGRISSRLLPALEDELLCESTIEALGRLGDEDVVAPLASRLNLQGSPAGTIAAALVAIYNRAEADCCGGVYVSDIVAATVDSKGARALLNTLSHCSGDELRAVAIVLGWLSDESIPPALVKLLGEPGARHEVVETLVRHGKRAIKPLVEQLFIGNIASRKAAAIALARIGDRSAVPALIRLLFEPSELAAVVAAALAKLGDPSAFEPLLGLLGAEDASTRLAAIAAIHSIGHPDTPRRIRELLESDSVLVRESAVRIAGYFGFEDCADGLFRLCRDPNDNVRCAVAEQLAFFSDPRALVALERFIVDDVAVVRAAAARGLAFAAPWHASSVLISALNDRDMWVRYYAARSLGHSADPESIDPLAALLREEGSPVQLAAIEALGRIGGPRVVALLAPLAENKDREVARRALVALGGIGHPDALAPLLAALRASDPAWRVEALRAVALRSRFGAAGALQFIAATDIDPEVMAVAIDTLGKLRSPESVGALVSLTADPIRRPACIAALSHLSESELPWIAFGLEHINEAVRCAVVEALALMKSPEASRLVADALEDRAASVRLAAASALRRLHSKIARKKLAALVKVEADPEVRRTVEAALAK